MLTHSSSKRVPSLAALAVLMGSWALLACGSPVRTQHQVMPGAEFSRYSTYAWATQELMAQGHPEAASYVSADDDRRIRTAVETALEKHGYRQLARDQADLLVAFDLLREQKSYSTAQPGTSTYVPDASGAPVWGGPVVDVHNYVEGTLTLQFFDRRNGQEVWAGWGSKRLTKAPDPPEKLQAAVDQILAEYPGAK